MSRSEYFRQLCMRVTKFTQSNKKVLASDNSDKIKLHYTASYLAERMLWSRLTIIEALDWRLESTVTSSAAVQLILAALSEREGHENNARMGDAKAHFIMEPCIVRGKRSPLSKDTYRATPTDLGLEIHNFLSLISTLQRSGIFVALLVNPNYGPSNIYKEAPFKFTGK